MKLKSLAAVVASGLSLVAFDASACAFTAWVPDTGSGTTSTTGVATDTTGTPLTASLIAGKPTTDTDAAAGVQGVRRYAGGCASLAKAPGNFTTDGSPNIEAAYRARFYVKAAAANNGAVVFQAYNAAAAPMITVTYNGAGLAFATTGGTASSQPVIDGRWYSVELNWAAGAAMTALVQGNATVQQTIVTTPAAAAGDRIDSARLGWISGGAGTPVTVDAFESRRTTAIGRLCRADANNDRALNVGDRVVITNEILGTGTAIGQPDANEDGDINAGDRVILTNLILASIGC